MTINRKLSVIDYALVVENIVHGYFGVNGEYQPHIGRVNAMRLFWNHCVTLTKYDKEIGHNVSNPIQLNDVFTDKEFIAAYYDEPWDEEGLTFDNAYNDAHLIIKDKLQSVNRIFDRASNLIENFMDRASESFDPELLNAIKSIANELGADKNMIDAIADLYQDSASYKNNIEMADRKE